MFSAVLNGLKSRRCSSGPRNAAKSRRPLLEPMEDRRLLSTVPLMMIDSPKVVEGTGGTTPMTFTVGLSSASTREITVNYRTIDLGAKAGSDYVAASGQLTFAPGQTSKTITIDVVADAVPESNESFYVALSGATNATLINTLGVGTILDDDAAVAPELSVNDVSMKRGLNGWKYMVFTVSLNTSNFKAPIAVTASTQALTAKAGVDFEMARQTLTFQPGEMSKTFAVKIFGTSTLTSDKIFVVNLTDTAAILRRPTGGGVIRYGA